MSDIYEKEHANINEGKWLLKIKIGKGVAVPAIPFLLKLLFILLDKVLFNIPHLLKFYIVYSPPNYLSFYNYS